MSESSSELDELSNSGEAGIISRQGDCVVSLSLGVMSVRGQISKELFFEIRGRCELSVEEIEDEREMGDKDPVDEEEDVESTELRRTFVSLRWVLLSA